MSKGAKEWLRGFEEKPLWLDAVWTARHFFVVDS